MQLTSRSRESHNNNIPIDRECNDTRHYTCSYGASEDLLEECGSNIEPCVHDCSFGDNTELYRNQREFMVDRIPGVVQTPR